MIITIKQGSHYSYPYSIGGFHNGRSMMQFNVRFDENALKMPNGLDCINDWNKLFGWSYGDHHKNSLRIGWRSAATRIQIGAYIYENGRRRSRAITYVNVGELVTMGIYHDHSLFTVRYYVGDANYHSTWGGCKPGWGYNLAPYYGGNCPAPTTMNIELLEL